MAIHVKAIPCFVFEPPVPVHYAFLWLPVGLRQLSLGLGKGFKFFLKLLVLFLTGL